MANEFIAKKGLGIGNLVSTLLKVNASGIVVAAVAGTDYLSVITLTTTGTSGAATFSSGTLNIPNYTLAGLGGQPLLTNPVTGTGTTNTVALFTGTSTIGNSVITQSGSTVGINAPTINTNASLDIQANSAAVVLSMRNRSAAGYAGVHFFNSDNTLVGHFGWGNTAAYNLQNNLYFGSLINAPLVLTTNDVERMRILGTGNIAIGKTTAATILDVNGTITATSFSGAGTGLTGTASSLSIGGTAASISGFGNPTTSATGNTIVYRDPNGYLFGNYINMTDDGNPGSGTSISSFITKQNDNYYRSVSPTNAMVSIRGVASGTWGINVTGYSTQLNGYANQTLYTILDGPANGPVIKVRYDSGTVNRYIDLGFKDGNGTYYSGFKIYDGNTPTWAGNTILHVGNYSSTLDGRYFFDYGFTDPYPATNANTMPGNRSAFTYSNNAPLTGCIAYFGAAGYGIQLNGDYGGDSFSMRSRNGDNGTWRPWKRLLTDYNYNLYSPTLTGTGASGTWGISITGNADTVDGYHATNAASGLAYYAANGYLYAPSWIQTNAGIFSSINSAHFLPNNHSYGSWKLLGERGGWRGLHFGENTGITLMMNEGEFGFHREAVGWVGRFTSGRYYGTSDNTVSISSAVGGAYTWTGIQYFETNNGGQAVNNSNSAKLQAYSTGNNSAFMSFHRAALYAVNFGLDDDNVMRIGGWSAGANRWQLALGSGNMTVAGDVTAFSDARVKTDIKTIENALLKVLNLRGVSYTRIDSEDKKIKIGVIAQETLLIVPEVVNQDNDGMYNVAYGNLAGLFIEAIKEQQNHIQNLQKQIDYLVENK
jgi:hypothetical protein